MTVNQPPPDEDEVPDSDTYNHEGAGPADPEEVEQPAAPDAPVEEPDPESEGGES